MVNEGRSSAFASATPSGLLSLLFSESLFLFFLVFDLRIMSSLGLRELPRRNTTLEELVQLLVRAALGLWEQPDAWDEIQCSDSGEE